MWISAARKSIAACCIAGFGLFSAAACHAQSAQPDVQAIIMQGPGHMEMVNMTYPRVIPAAQAARDVAALARCADLGAVQVDVTNGAEKLAKVKTVPMTSATFAASGMLPDDHNETAFHIEPWVIALKNYHTLTITYLMDRDFGFDGLRDYRDGNVEIALDREGNAYTYRITILNPNFVRLNLPFLQPDISRTTLADNTAGHPWYIACFFAVSAIAAGFGYGVWTMLTKLA